MDRKFVAEFTDRLNSMLKSTSAELRKEVEQCDIRIRDINEFRDQFNNFVRDWLGQLNESMKSWMDHESDVKDSLMGRIAAMESNDNEPN